MENRRVLIIEDEKDIANLLVLHLRDLQAKPHVCHDGAQGLQIARQSNWDLLILDLRLPGLDGLEICRRLRAEGNTTPILMLTAKTAELDRVLGLEVGADDYVTKPFSVIEVMARVRALVRRAGFTQPDQLSTPAVVRWGNLQIDEGRRLAEVHKPARAAVERLDLTAREFDLLLFFARAPGKVFRRAQLLDAVWGCGHEGYEHTVNSHINRLRAKLSQADPEHDYVVTVWGVGYKFNDELMHAA